MSPLFPHEQGSRKVRKKKRRIDPSTLTVLRKTTQVSSGNMFPTCLVNSVPGLEVTPTQGRSGDCRGRRDPTLSTRSQGR